MATRALSQYADDDDIRRAVQLARRLPASGRKPAEYLLAAAVLELNKRLEEALAEPVADERASA